MGNKLPIIKEEKEPDVELKAEANLEEEDSKAKVCGMTLFAQNNLGVTFDKQA